MHLVAAAILGSLAALFTGLGWWVLPLTLAAACMLAAAELAVGERQLRRALVGPGVAHSTAVDDPRLANIVDGVCLLVGVPPPTLVVARTTAANATAFGRRPTHATIVVTQGLLDSLGRIELEAVAARLLTQIRDGRTACATTAVTTVGLPALLLPAVWPLVKARVEREARASDDFDDDAEAVRLTRYPPGLASGLVAMSASGVDTGAPAVTWPLWLADPRADSAAAAADLPDYRSDLDTRIAVLREL